MLEAKIAVYEDRVRVAFCVGDRCVAIHAVEVEPSWVGSVVTQYRAGCATIGIPVEGVSAEDFPEVAAS